MATVNKDFKIKSGLVVEGTTATVNGQNILRETASDAYILGLTGGATLVKSVSAQFDVSGAGELSLDRATVDAYYDAAGAASTAQSNAQTFATNADTALYGTVTTDIATAKSQAGVIAQGYADTAEADAISAAASDATTKANAAQSAAEATASADATAKVAAEAALRVSGDAASVSTAAADATAKANAAQAAAEATASADATAKANAAQAAAIAAAATDATSKANTALASANTYTDGAVSALVDSAPELLNTLNELAAALGDSPDTIANLTTLVGTKASTTYVDSEISDLDTAAQGYATAAQSAAVSTASADATAKVAAEAALRVSGDAASVSTASADATTKANAAQAAAEATAAAANSSLYTTVTSDIATAKTAAEATAQGYANTAESNAIAHADALDTDDIAEGTAQYFTDARAKSSAAALLTGATKTNITITGTGAGLTITAENGVADSTTSDLAEGTNLYFTDARARSAVDGTTRSFTAVQVNSVAKQVASTLSAPTAGIQTAHAWAKADYRSAEFLVKVAYGTHTEVSKVLLTLDSSDNIAITEYGIVGTNGSASTISAGISGTDVQLLVTTANNNSTVTVMGTLLA